LCNKGSDSKSEHLILEPERVAISFNMKYIIGGEREELDRLFAKV
jgi:hypothetical protein